MDGSNRRSARARMLVSGLAVVALAAGCGSSASPAAPPRETAGGAVHTWSDYQTAGGRPGTPLRGGQTVAVSCRVQGFTVQDGDRWWYRLPSSPWHDRYYASADAFYNDGRTSGSLHGTPFMDAKVPICSGG